MLKNLFNKIKTQKSLSIKKNQENQQGNQKGNDEIKIHTTIDKDENFQCGVSSEQLKILGQQLSIQAQRQQNIIHGEISQVRYWVNLQIPQIFNSILTCPISQYNLLPHSKRKVKQIDLKVDKFPQYLQFMKPLLQKQLPQFNHILINHYPVGTGIMHHFDGPLYQQKVVVLSLGGPALITFNENYSKEKKNLKVLLQDRSIHIFQRKAYTKYLHGIQDRKIDTFTFKIIKKNTTQTYLQQSVLLKQNHSSLKSQTGYFIVQNSIDNFDKIHLIKQIIEKHLSQLTFQTNTDEYLIQFNQFQGIRKLKGYLIYINETQKCDSKQDQANKVVHIEQKMNQTQFKWKIQIQRQQRISITIRQKYTF